METAFALDVEKKVNRTLFIFSWGVMLFFAATPILVAKGILPTIPLRSALIVFGVALTTTVLGTIAYFTAKKYFKYIIICVYIINVTTMITHEGLSVLMGIVIPGIISCFYFNYRVTLFTVILSFIGGFFVALYMPEGLRHIRVEDFFTAHITIYLPIATILALLSHRFEKMLAHILEGEGRQKRLLDEMAEVLDKAKLSAEQVSSSSTEMEGSSQKSKSNIYEVAAVAEELSASVQEVSSNSEVINQVSLSVVDKSESGEKIIEEIVSRVNTIRDVMANLEDSISSLDSKLGNINEFAQTITAISDQTNLLSLNAAIEAARAGEHGRGFAVVAQEVRVLADNCAEAARSIGESTANIRSEMAGVNSTMKAGSEETNQSALFLDQARQAFNEIVKSIKEMADLIQHNTVALKQIGLAGGELSESVNKQLSEIETVVSQSSTLSAVARELGKIVKKLDTEH